ncbi:MAG: hypothetical protein ACOC93_00895, partial [Planctomycetota bacterium]
MTLEIREDVAPAGWDERVASLDGTVFHTSAYAEHICVADPNAAARFVSLLSDDGEPLAVALAFESRSDKAVLAPLTGTFRLASLPAVGQGGLELSEQFLRLTEPEARTRGNVVLAVESLGAVGRGEELGTLGYEQTHRLEFELPLDRDDDTLWSGMEHKRRKNVKKAQRNEVTLRDMPGADGLAELRRLQGRSADRIVARGGKDIS